MKIPTKQKPIVKLTDAEVVKVVGQIRAARLQAKSYGLTNPHNPSLELAFFVGGLSIILEEIDPRIGEAVCNLKEASH